MAAEQLAFVLIAIALAGIQVMDRLDRRRERKEAKADRREVDQERDADRTIALKEERICALEGKVVELERTAQELKDDNVRLRRLLRLMFDELVKTDRCARARTGCPNREIPGDMHPELVELRAELVEADDNASSSPRGG